MAARSALDVAIVGDGPAGSALARQLADQGVDVALFGNDQRWEATYTTWADDLDGVPVLAGADIWLHRFETVAAHFDRDITIDRPYGVIDNEMLRDVLRRGVEHRIGTVGSSDELGARIVVDATGWPSGLDRRDRELAEGDGVAWQTALGVVLDEPPSGPLGRPTVMDFSGPAQPGGDVDLPTFAYAFPVVDGWLVEETVLAGPRLDPDRLTARLAARLDEPASSLLSRARRVERVRIPMGAPVPETPGVGLPAQVRFGAAAGMIHTATGYSVASSLRAVERVGDAIVRQRHGTPDARALADAVWPRPLLRSRRLHDFGLDVLLTMDRDQLRRFFQTFFELPTERWASYLRVDTPPATLAGVMTAMFRRADRSLRRELVTGNPRLLLRALWP